MKAAKNFVFGDGTETRNFKVGDDVPDKVAKEVDDSFILEKVAKSDPNSLTRAQLLDLAGVSSLGEENKEMDADEFQVALQEFRTKADLVDWANEAYGVEMDSKLTRDELEGQIMTFQFEDSSEEE